MASKSIHVDFDSTHDDVYSYHYQSPALANFIRKLTLQNERIMPKDTENIYVPVVLQIMENNKSDATLQTLMCSVLCNMCRHGQSIDIILESGGVGMIAAAMASFPRNETVQLQGCAVLSHLTKYGKIGARAVKREGGKNAMKVAALHFPKTCGKVYGEVRDKLLSPITKGKEKLMLGLSKLASAPSLHY